MTAMLEVKVPKMLFLKWVSCGLCLTRTSDTALGVNSLCNLDCACSKEYFNPVCGSNSFTYMSPCHAGCLEKGPGVSIKKYPEREGVGKVKIIGELLKLKNLPEK